MALILVVDDEQPMLDLISGLIVDAGHTPLKARHGMEALACVYQHRPAFILSDVMMPMMNGVAFAQALADDLVFSTIPIVLMSASTCIPSSPSNVIGILLKPFDVMSIEGMVRRVN